MSVFTDREVEYLRTQRLGRLATVGPDGMPHVVPVGFVLDATSDTIRIRSRVDLSATKKFRDAARHPQAAFVVDDVVSWDPPAPRGIEIRGPIDALAEGGEGIGEALGMGPFASAWLCLRPRRIIAWGIEGEPFEPPNSRDVG